MKEIASLKEKKKRKSLQLMTRLELIISILAWISALICLTLLIWMFVAKADLIFLTIFSVATMFTMNQRNYYSKQVITLN